VSNGTALDAVPLNAVVASPAAGVLPAGEHAVGGWAIGTAGSPLVSVELSTDDGLTWRATDFERDGPAWTWRPWRATVHLNPGAHVLVVRASDACGNTQPRDVQSTWNVKGYCNNAWHRVAVECE
jgi:hypothetical protein